MINTVKKNIKVLTVVLIGIGSYHPFSIIKKFHILQEKNIKQIQSNTKVTTMKIIEPKLSLKAFFMFSWPLSNMF